MLNAENDSALDRLVTTSYDTGARSALMEMHRMLKLHGHHEAADVMLNRIDVVVRRTNADPLATLEIDRIRRGE
jgi:hypothetical protein